jgi:thermostable 8-oxoguanine DNA glycosylase
MSQFTTADDFYKWADLFEKDDRARPALPLLLSCEIYGLGFALACDFLKELGYANYAKPDVHVRDIFEGLGLCQKASDYQLFKTVVRVAKNVEVTPYNVDKLFWLIGSGHFYAHPRIGVNGRIGSQKRQFIASAQELFLGKGLV